MSDEQHRINLEHRLEAAKAEITALQERVSFAETARDNAIVQGDEAQRRAKVKVAHAGRIIADLIGLLRPMYAVNSDLETQVKVILATATSPEEEGPPA